MAICFFGVFMLCQCGFLRSGRGGEGERTYEEKPFGEEAFGLGEVGCQEGGHGEFVFWEWFCWKWYFILSSGMCRWCWVV